MRHQCAASLRQVSQASAARSRPAWDGLVVLFQRLAAAGALLQLAMFGAGAHSIEARCETQPLITAGEDEVAEV